MSRIAILDLLRAVAVLAVIVVHVAQLTGEVPEPWRSALLLGQYGVQVFFCLSVLLAARSAMDFGDRASIARWLWRRFLRIAPLYYYGVALYTVVNVLLVHLGAVRAKDGVGPVEIAANVLLIHSIIPAANNSVVPGGWSIGMEWLFYLMFPAWARWTSSAGRASVMLAIGCGIAVFAGLVVYPVVNNAYSDFYPISQLPVFMWGWFCCVMTGVGSLISAHLTAVRARHVLMVNFFAVILIGAASVLSPALQPLLLNWLIAPIVCLVVVAGRGISASGRLWSVVRSVSGLSYGIYVNHFVCLWVSKAILERLVLRGSLEGLGGFALLFGATSLGALGIARVTRVLVEAPFSGIREEHRMSTVSASANSDS